MKILVGVKRVIDYNVKPRVKSDGSGVDLSNVKMSMNPFDEVAVEEAVRLKEAGLADEIIALSIGAQASQETLRTALAMGADRALLIKSEARLEPLAIAKIFKHVIMAEKPDLVFLGKQAIDDDCNQTGQMLAALLDWGQATFVSAISVDINKVEATREVDNGLQVIEISLPAIVTVDLRLNEPRFASLPNIMKAKKIAIEEKDIADLGLDLRPRLEVLKVEEPPKRKAGTRVGTIDELIFKLKEEAGLL